MVIGKATIDERGTLCSIIKDEPIVFDDSDFISVSTRGTENEAYRIFLITFWPSYNPNFLKKIISLTIAVLLLLPKTCFFF